MPGGGEGRVEGEERVNRREGEGSGGGEGMERGR